MSHFKVYYPECSQNEILEEKTLLARVNYLPEFLQMLIGEFSPIVAQQKALVKYEFFDRWIITNTERIMNLVEGWTKPQVGFVLNSIIRLSEPDFNGYLKGESCYQHWPAAYMRKQIKVYISHRTKQLRPDIIADMRGERTFIVHKFVPCVVNPAFEDCPPIRIWGAYKAIEQFDQHLKAKKRKSKK